MCEREIESMRERDLHIWIERGVGGGGEGEGEGEGFVGGERESGRAGEREHARDR